MNKITRAAASAIMAAGLFLSTLASADSFAPGYIPGGLQTATDDTVPAPATPTPPACYNFTDGQFTQVIVETWGSYEEITPAQIVAWVHDPAVLAALGPTTDEAIIGYSLYVTVADKTDGDGQVWALLFDANGCYVGGVLIPQDVWQTAYDNVNKPGTAEAPKA